MQDNTRAEESKQLLLKVSQYYPLILPAGVWLGLSHAGNLNVFDAGQMHVGYSEPAGLRLQISVDAAGARAQVRLCACNRVNVLSTLTTTLKIEFYKNTYPMHCITMCYFNYGDTVESYFVVIFE